jgi:hypothetical protein
MALARRDPQIAVDMKSRHSHALLLLLSLSSLPALARDGDGGWKFLVAPYLMFPNMKGEVGLADLPAASVDADPSDIFSHLQMGAMLFVEARNDTWAFSSDVLYMDLDSDLAPNRVVSSGSAGMSQVGWELAAMRRLTPWFELGLSAVYNKIDADVKMTFVTNLGTSTRHVALSQDWIDPTVVMRATFPIGAKWAAQIRANVGGFGVGSDLFWELQADAVCHHSDQWQFALGYRLIDFDYQHGTGVHRFSYDMQNFGPVLKLGYSF